MKPRCVVWRWLDMSGDNKYRYRGYDIVPQRQWSSWCVGVYPSSPDLPILARSTVETLAPRKDEAVTEAQRIVDALLARLSRGTA